MCTFFLMYHFFLSDKAISFTTYIISYYTNLIDAEMVIIIIISNNPIFIRVSPKDRASAIVHNTGLLRDEDFIPVFQVFGMFTLYNIVPRSCLQSVIVYV